MGFVANFIRFLAVQKFRKSVKIWQSYREYKSGNFFLRHCWMNRRTVVISVWCISRVCWFQTNIVSLAAARQSVLHASKPTSHNLPINIVRTFPATNCQVLVSGCDNVTYDENLWAFWRRLITLSPPIPLRLYTLPYWSNPPFLIFDIWALWCSALSARVAQCQKLKIVG